MNRNININQIKLEWLQQLEISETLAVKSLMEATLTFAVGYPVQFIQPDSDFADPENYLWIVKQSIALALCKAEDTRTKDLYLFNQSHWVINRMESFLMEIIGDPQYLATNMKWIFHYELFLHHLTAYEDDKMCNTVGAFIRKSTAFWCVFGLYLFDMLQELQSLWVYVKFVVNYQTMTQ